MRTVIWGDWTVDLTTRQVTPRSTASEPATAGTSGELVRKSEANSTGTNGFRLSLKAVAVLRALDGAPDRLLSRGDLLDAVWPDVTVGEEVLTHAIAELRRAAGDDRRAPRYIATVHKHGYRLIEPLQPVAGSANRPVTRRVTLNRPANDPGPIPADLGSPIPEDLDDYAQQLTAARLFEQGGRRNLQEAARLFGDLVERWPNSTANAGLAQSLTFLNLYYGRADTIAGVAKALEASEIAVRSNPLSVEAQAARGLALAQSGKIQAARMHFQKAIRLRPDSAETHRLLGHASFNWGDLTLSALMLEQAARLNPDDFHTLMLAAKLRSGMGDAESAKADVVKAIPRMETYLLAAPNDFRVLCGKARALFELGLTADALDAAGPLLNHDDPMDYYFASLLARMGEVPLAIDRLETSVDVGWRNGALLLLDPDFAALRGEPRFRRLVAQLNAA